MWRLKGVRRVMLPSWAWPCRFELLVHPEVKLTLRLHPEVKLTLTRLMHLEDVRSEEPRARTDIFVTEETSPSVPAVSMHGSTPVGSQEQVTDASMGTVMSLSASSSADGLGSGLSVDGSVFGGSQELVTDATMTTVMSLSASPSVPPSATLVPLHNENLDVLDKPSCAVSFPSPGVYDLLQASTATSFGPTVQRSVQGSVL